MEVKIQAIHFEISEKLTNFTNKKIDRLARRFDTMTSVNVNYTLVKPESANNKECSVEVSVPGAGQQFANKCCDTFEEALDTCLDAIERQLERKK